MIYGSNDAQKLIATLKRMNCLYLRNNKVLVIIRLGRAAQAVET
jgi:hypothetical protein